jgi:hypothetical protein
MMTPRVTRMVVVAAVLGTLALSGAGCSERGVSTDIPVPEGASQETTETSVFFATGRSLLEEPRIVRTAEAYRETLEEWLLATPEINPDVAIVQPVAEVLDMQLEGGVLTIDWSAQILDFEADPAEQRIALAGILRTFGQFPEIESVRFTVQGQEDGEVGGKDVRSFWGGVSLIGQPWEVLRPAPISEDATGTAEPTEGE